MHQAAQALAGEHDFSSFRAAGCQSRTPIRFLGADCEVTRKGDFVVIDVQANAFLHHMVRNIAGALMAVGSGKQRPEWIREILVARDRTACRCNRAAPWSLSGGCGVSGRVLYPLSPVWASVLRGPGFSRAENSPITPTHIHPQTAVDGANEYPGQNLRSDPPAGRY